MRTRRLTDPETGEAYATQADKQRALRQREADRARERATRLNEEAKYDGVRKLDAAADTMRAVRSGAAVGYVPVKVQTMRRVVVDEGRVLIERQELQRLEDVQEKSATALIEAAKYAQRAFDEAYRAQTLAADLIGVVRELGSLHGISVKVADGRATVTRDPNTKKTLDEARFTFHALAREAAKRMEQEVADGLRRLLTEEGQYLRSAVAASIEHYAKRLGDSPSA